MTAESSLFESLEKHDFRQEQSIKTTRAIRRWILFYVTKESINIKQ